MFAEARVTHIHRGLMIRKKAIFLGHVNTSLRLLSVSLVLRENQ